MSNIGFSRGDILIPQNIDLYKWCTVACDQYTSEEKYWDDVSLITNGAPSSLNIVFPEIYLNKGENEGRTKNINDTMECFISTGIFREVKQSLIYVERVLDSGMVRCGIVGAMDLEEYDYFLGSQTLIRATEGTVLDRLPPRTAVRKDAPIETPHVMALIDDEGMTVIEPLKEKRDSMECLYSTRLMKRGGSIAGYRIDDESIMKIESALASLADRSEFNKKYGAPDKGVLLFAMGDGNHSIAAAKRHYEDLKKALSQKEALAHPARYALAEIVNLHSPALEFEPIHRVIFGADTSKFEKEMADNLGLDYKKPSGQKFEYIINGESRTAYITKASSKLTVGSVQNFIDSYISAHGGSVDYIHGDDVVRSLAKKDGNVGFILPNMQKNELFKTVIFDGALPRKTFSMGHAWDKRFYLECRKIK